MKKIAADSKLIAYCGLYCGACRSFLKGSCPGCSNNAKATWCKVRTCNMGQGFASCADCKEFSNPMDCTKYNTFISRVIGFLFKSDRNACLAMIRREGYDRFANFMAQNEQQTIRKK